MSRLVAMATAGRLASLIPPSSRAELAGSFSSHLHLDEDTARRQDLATNPRVAFTTWQGPTAWSRSSTAGAREVPSSLRLRGRHTGRPAPPRH